jgi:methionine-rich copper-binding protein CopC
MSEGAAAARYRPRLLAAGILVLVTLVIVALRGGIGGEPRLTGMDPPDGARLDTFPSTVTLDFADDPQVAHLVAEDPAGRTVSSGEARIDGGRVVVPVRAGSDGLYQIGYHVTFARGGELAGTTSFTVGAAGAAGKPAPPDATAGHTHLGTDPLSLVLLAVDLPLTAALMFLLLRRPRMRTPR